MYGTLCIVVVHVLFIVVTFCCRVRSVYEGVFIVVRPCFIVLLIVLYSPLYIVVMYCVVL